MKIIALGIVDEWISKYWYRTNKKSNNALLLFCGYSDYEIPVGYVFNKITKEDEIMCTASITLKAVTQQYFKPFDCIPNGWKTISEFEFDVSTYEMMKKQMPIIDDWYSESRMFFTFIRVKL